MSSQPLPSPPLYAWYRGGQRGQTCTVTTSYTAKQAQKKTTLSRQSSKRESDTKQIKHKSGEGWVGAVEQKQGGARAAELLSLLWAHSKGVMSVKHNWLSFIFQCTLVMKGIWCLGCSEQCDGSNLSDHRRLFEVEQNSVICKWAAATPKQHPTANRDVIVFTQQEKLPANINSLWSSTVAEKLIIAACEV